MMQVTVLVRPQPPPRKVGQTLHCLGPSVIVAMLINAAKIITLAMIAEWAVNMDKQDMPENGAVSELANLFENAGWQVDREPNLGLFRPDFLLSKQGNEYGEQVNGRFIVNCPARDKKLFKFFHNGEASND